MDITNCKPGMIVSTWVYMGNKYSPTGASQVADSALAFARIVKVGKVKVQVQTEQGALVWAYPEHLTPSTEGAEYLPQPTAKEKAQALHADLTARLKQVQTVADLKALVAEAENNPDAHIELQGKRRGYSTHGFTANAYNPNRVHYLYDDGASTGKALIANLYKVLRWVIWYDGGVIK